MKRFDLMVKDKILSSADFYVTEKLLSNQLDKITQSLNIKWQRTPECERFIVTSNSEGMMMCVAPPFVLILPDGQNNISQYFPAHNEGWALDIGLITSPFD